MAGFFDFGLLEIFYYALIWLYKGNVLAISQKEIIFLNELSLLNLKLGKLECKLLSQWYRNEHKNPIGFQEQIPGALNRLNHHTIG